MLTGLLFPVQVPEPDAEGLVQLQDMGFSAGLAAKALLLSRNMAAAALDWALQHADDPDADAPPTEEALRAGVRACTLKSVHDQMACSGSCLHSFLLSVLLREHAAGGACIEEPGLKPPGVRQHLCNSMMLVSWLLQCGSQHSGGGGPGQAVPPTRSLWSS